MSNKKDYAQADVLAPRSRELEFGGVLGALFITVTVPLTMYYLTFGCSAEMGCSLPLSASNAQALWTYVRQQLVASFQDRMGWNLYYCLLYTSPSPRD